MTISCRMGTLSEGGIQGNSKWKNYHHPPISSQIPAQCLYCREGNRTHKKKVVNKRSNKERVCKKCGKEFLYPSKLEQHLANKTTCIFSSSSSTISRSSSVSNSTISESSLSDSTITRSSTSSFEKKIWCPFD